MVAYALASNLHTHVPASTTNSITTRLMSTATTNRAICVIWIALRITTKTVHKEPVKLYTDTPTNNLPLAPPRYIHKTQTTDKKNTLRQNNSHIYKHTQAHTN
eukprot:GHVQ01034998.1.p1 GENE.GHVQ01034998.1~~GHVQ01034998.1.p1  ORF type:complete len:103 (+),score=20.01 GHVQ01034998.1:456-764(+)